MKILEELSERAQSFPERLEKAKGEGAQAVGHTGRFAPEELIHACGGVPYYLCRGGEPEPPEAVLPYMLRFMSPFARAQIGYHLLEKEPVIPMLDLVVAQCDDCHMTRLADLIEYFELPTARVGVPTDWDKSLSAEYYRRSLTQLRRRLAELSGTEITDERLRGAIELMNTLRDRFRRIDGLRAKPRPAFGGDTFLRLNHLSFKIPPQEMVAALDRLHDQWSAADSPFPAEAPRILLAGHVVAEGDYFVPSLIEELGGVVVAEMLDEGHRYHRWDVPTEGDPLENIARTYYQERTPPSVFQPAWEVRLDHLLKIAKERRIDGVAWYQLSFEEIYNMEYSYVAKQLGARGIPVVKLESAYESSREATGALATRIESFLASVSAGRGQGTGRKVTT
jgi:benzoyl-CoA reductase/2-hydroxyglutaryl-CoA dehydratase subunit BcrC/BadD/HgdB